MSALNDEIRRRTSDGWALTAQTETTASMTKKGSGKSCLLIVILLMLGIVPGILYILWPRREQVVFLELQPDGTVRASGRGVSQPSRYSMRDRLIGGVVIAVVVLVLLAIAGALSGGEDEGTDDTSSVPQPSATSEQYGISYLSCGHDIEQLFREAGTTDVEDAAQWASELYVEGSIRDEAREGCLAALREDPAKTEAAAIAAMTPTAVPTPEGTPHNVAPAGGVSTEATGRTLQVAFEPNVADAAYDLLITNAGSITITEGWDGLAGGFNYDLSGALAFSVVETRPAAFLFEVYGPVSGTITITGEFASGCEPIRLDDADWVQVWTQLDTCEVLR